MGSVESSEAWPGTGTGRWAVQALANQQARAQMQRSRTGPQAAPGISSTCSQIEPADLTTYFHGIQRFHYLVEHPKRPPASPTRFVEGRPA